jgi:2-iminobutanoate/2-iminopropanoate deaminase
LKAASRTQRASRRVPAARSKSGMLLTAEPENGMDMKKSFVRGTWQKARAFSPAVITSGPTRTIYLAGHYGHKADDGSSLAGSFDEQCKQAFRAIERTLAEAGAKLSDLVTMTVFLVDPRLTTRMTEIRTEIFKGDFPASAAITVTGFSDPAILLEIQGIAVVAA